MATEFKAAFDGYTSVRPSACYHLRPQVSYTIDDFIPVALSNRPIIMIAGKDSGITSVDDLLEMDSATYGFSGSGSLVDCPRSSSSAWPAWSNRHLPMTAALPPSRPCWAATLTSAPDIGEVDCGMWSPVTPCVGIFNDERDPQP